MKKTSAIIFGGASPELNKYVAKLSQKHLFLKNYQALILNYIFSPKFSDKQMLLLYLAVGRGKTLLSISCGVLGLRSGRFDRVIILSPKTVQDEFRRNLFFYFFFENHMDKEAAKKCMDEFTKYFIMIHYNSWDSYQRFSQLKKLEKTLFIIDEAHLYAKSIIKTNILASDYGKNLRVDKFKGNCLKINDAISAVKDKLVLCLTGTPSAKTPYELVPLFNLATFGKELFHEDYEEFNKKFIDGENAKIMHKNILLDKLDGLIAYVPAVEGQVKATPLQIVEVEMSEGQYKKYLEDYAVEKLENGFTNKKNMWGLLFGSKCSFHAKTFSDCIYWDESGAKNSSHPSHKDAVKGVGKDAVTHDSSPPSSKDAVTHDSSPPSSKDAVTHETVSLERSEMSDSVVNAAKDADGIIGGDTLIHLDKQHCPKIFRMYEDTKEVNGLCVFYFRFTNIHGVLIMEEMLKKHGYRLPSRGEDVFASKSKRYVVFTGSISNDLRDAWKKMFNDKRNCRGEYIKYMILSPSGIVGITLHNVRYLGIGSVEFNYSNIRQLLGRVNRLNSHKDLPEKDRKLVNKIYLMTKNEKYYRDHKQEVEEISDRTTTGYTLPCPTIERIIYQDSLHDDVINEKFRKDILIKASITEELWQSF